MLKEHEDQADTPKTVESRPRWTESEKSLASFMLGLGLGYRSIAAAVGRSAGTVSTRITRKRIIPDQDVDPLDLAAGEGRSWTEDEETLLGDLVRKRMRPAKIASMLHRTEASVRTRIVELEIGEVSQPRVRLSPAMRTCVSCGREFTSEGVHHRICNSCKGSLED